jgi:putative lipoic acid-binding regulatory protein
MSEKEPSKLTFPCEFTFKVIGPATNDLFESEVLQIFRHHFPSMGEGAITSKLSKNDKYLALTILVTAASQAQLDNIYQVLSHHPLVLFVL